jgi:integrase
LDRDLLLSELSDELIAAYLAWLKNRPSRAANHERSISLATVRKHQTHLLAMWRLARRRSIRERLGEAHCPAHDPDLDPVRVPKRSPEALSVVQVGSLLSIAAQQDGHVSGVPSADWWEAFLMLMYFTGWRVDSLLQLPRDAWSIGPPATIKLPAELNKQRADDVRLVNTRLADSIERVVGGHRCPKMFGGDMSYVTALRRMRRMWKAAGLPRLRKYFHALRAAHAVACENAGLNATESLGHSSRRVTVDHYLPGHMLEKPQPGLVLPQPEYVRQLKLFG